MSEAERRIENSRSKLKSPRKSKTRTISPRNVWHNLDFSSDEDNYPELPRRTISEGGNTLSNLKDIIMGQRFVIFNKIHTF